MATLLCVSKPGEPIAIWRLTAESDSCLRRRRRRDDLVVTLRGRWLFSSVPSTPQAQTRCCGGRAERRRLAYCVIIDTVANAGGMASAGRNRIGRGLSIGAGAISVSSIIIIRLGKRGAARRRPAPIALLANRNSDGRRGVIFCDEGHRRASVVWAGVVCQCVIPVRNVVSPACLADKCK